MSHMTDERGFIDACKNSDISTINRLFGSVEWKTVKNCLFVAAKTGNLEVIKCLHALGADLSKIDNALLRSTFSDGYGHVNVLSYLLEAIEEIDVNYRCGKMCHILVGAVLFNQTEIAIKLIEHKGCDLNWCQSMEAGGHCALTFAVMNGNLDIVNKLLDAGAEYKNINLPAKENLLHIAARSGNYDMIKRVLSLDLDINQKNWRGYTPIMECHRLWAVNTPLMEWNQLWAGNTEIPKKIFKLFIDKGASIDMDIINKRNPAIMEFLYDHI